MHWESGKGDCTYKRIGRTDPGVILLMKNFLKSLLSVARQYNLNTGPFDLQGYLYFQDQNKSQQDSSVVITERELGKPFTLQFSVNTVTETE